MRRWWFVPAFILLLAACGKTNGNGPEQPLAPAPAATSPVATSPVATSPVATSPAATEPAGDSYPGPATPLAPAGGYPGPAATSTPSPYPAGSTVWLLKPAGAQCQAYEVDRAGAVKTLEDAGIPVLDSEVTSLPVCEACDICASSEHYRVLIDRSQLPQAEALGWKQE